MSTKEEVIKEFENIFVVERNSPCHVCWHRHMNNEEHTCECHGRTARVFVGQEEDIKSFLLSKLEEQKKALLTEIEGEIERAENALEHTPNLDRITFYEGYIKGLKFIQSHK